MADHLSGEELCAGRRLGVCLARRVQRQPLGDTDSQRLAPCDPHGGVYGPADGAHDAEALVDVLAELVAVTPTRDGHGGLAGARPQKDGGITQSENGVGHHAHCSAGHLACGGNALVARRGDGGGGGNDGCPDSATHRLHPRRDEVGGCLHSGRDLFRRFENRHMVRRDDHLRGGWGEALGNGLGLALHPGLGLLGANAHTLGHDLPLAGDGSCGVRVAVLVRDPYVSGEGTLRRSDAVPQGATETLHDVRVAERAVRKRHLDGHRIARFLRHGVGHRRC
mmetsp:Transcript_24753/g.53603  ORF Transcript_24753/g.53603 Transcript_24753/m.53603 type:complete len:280 (-) Transcript_24753:46-885(-)